MGQTPLLLASEKGYDEIVELLMAQPRIDKRCLGSVAPLHAAVEYGHLTVAQKLIEGGWNCNQVSFKCLLCILFLMRNVWSSTIHYFGYIPTLFSFMLHKFSLWIVCNNAPSNFNGPVGWFCKIHQLYLCRWVALGFLQNFILK